MNFHDSNKLKTFLVLKRMPISSLTIVVLPRIRQKIRVRYYRGRVLFSTNQKRESTVFSLLMPAVKAISFSFWSIILTKIGLDFR